MKLFRNHLFARILAIYSLGSLLAQLFIPLEAWALTSGPEQPEIQGFTPAGMTEMVNPATGDFTYNIPLMSVEGYPINITYQSGVGMEDEASMVGLGWNLSIGQINRNVRGLPDDFKGEEIVTTMKQAKRWKVGLNLSVAPEALGIEFEELKKFTGSASVSVNVGLFYDSYTGVGTELGVSPQVGISRSLGKIGSRNLVGSLGGGLNLGLNSQSGSSIGASANAGFSLSKKDMIDQDIEEDRSETSWITRTNKISLGLSSVYNSRSGISYYNSSLKASRSRTNSTLKIKLLKNNLLGASYNFSASSQSIGAGASGLYELLAPTFTPSAPFPYRNFGATIGVGLGAKVPLFTDAKSNLTGYYTEQDLKFNKRSSEAYGYLHLSEGHSENRKQQVKRDQEKHILTDYNRVNNRPFIQDATPNLAFSHLTFDTYSVSGHGISGTFRPYRNELGIVTNSYQKDRTLDGSLGLELGGGVGFDFGIDVAPSKYLSYASEWQDHNALKSEYNYGKRPDGTASKESQAQYEPFYFKQVGELTGSNDEGYLESLGDEKPLTVKLNEKQWGGGHYAQASFIGNGQSYQPEAFRLGREKRNQLFTYLTGEEAEKYGLKKRIYSYELATDPATGEPRSQNQLKEALADSSDRVDILEGRQPHHISEIRVLKSDGVRYVYNIPTQNNHKVETSFNVSGRDTMGLRPYGLTNYELGQDDNLNNKRGIDKFFNKVETPAYATGYLLGAVLSPDYVDRTGNGPSHDDLGTFYEMRYHRLHKSYKWRMPLAPKGESGPVASFDPGLKMKPKDDKANIVYGDRENWALAQVVARNRIAIFHYSERNDGLGVLDSSGTQLDTENRLLKLDRITLHTYKDWKEHKNEAKPLKTVSFFYDYSLRKEPFNYDNPDDPSDKGGALTLKRIEMSSEESGRATLNPYRFTYNDDLTHNPNYHPKAYDRWGSYKPMNASLPTWEFPYVDQESLPSGQGSSNVPWTQSDIYAQAWNLQKIETPTGAEINVHYEADDYAYVQDHRAGQMMKILGFSNTSNTDLAALSGEIYKHTTSTPRVRTAQYNRFVYVQLPEEVDVATDIKEKYLNEDGLVFMNLSVKISPKKGTRERVPAWVRISKVSVHPTNRSIAVLELPMLTYREKKKDSGEKIPELLMTLMNYTRMHLPEYVYEGSAPLAVDTANIQSALSQLVLLQEGFKELVTNINGAMIRKKYCQVIDPQLSWVRLYNGNGFKAGGGCRVWKITMRDGLDKMTGEREEEYGSIYDYTMVEDFGGEKDKRISSGVAAYEPLIGGDEISLRKPITYKLKRILYPDDAFYIEGPFGEEFFPSPTVTYRQVQVRGLTEETGYNHASQPYQQYEFYTAKEFPVITQHSRLVSQVDEPNKIEKFLGLGNFFSTNTQGYSVKINSMHGVPKAELSFAEGDTLPYAGSEYIYHTKPKTKRQVIYTPLLNQDTNDLTVETDTVVQYVGYQGLANDDLLVIERDGSLRKKTIGREFDLTIDSREQFSSTEAVDVQANLEGELLPPSGALFVFGSAKKSTKRFRSLVTNKVVAEVGILKEVKSYRDGTVITTENLAYDAETGAPLITKVTNEFDDDLYSSTQPAHWVYRGMAQAYQNQGIEITNAHTSNGAAPTFNNLAPVLSLFQEGDELRLKPLGLLADEVKGWVLHVDKVNNELKVVDRQGTLISVANGNTVSDSYSSFKIVRSGHRNMAQMPIGNISTQSNPIVNDTELNYQDILSASATEFSDEWQTFCSSTITTPSCDCEVPNQKARDFLDVFEDVLSSGRLFSPNMTVVSHVSQNFNGSSELALALGYNFGEDFYWKTTITGGNPNALTQLKFELFKDDGPETCNIKSACDLNIDIPSNLSTTDLEGMTNLRIVDANVSDCNNSQNFLIQAETGGQTYNLLATGFCFDAKSCPPRVPELIVCQGVGDQVNPYVVGIRGTYLPKMSYTYLTDRTAEQTSYQASNEPDVRNGGTYVDFSAFWQYQNNEWTANSTNWIWGSENMTHIPLGLDIESRDVLNRYSSVQYGHNYQVPIAVAANSPIKNMGATGFEEPGEVIEKCGNHLRFTNAGDKPQFSNEEAHTGSNSMLLYPWGSTSSVQAEIRSDDPCTKVPDADNIPYLIKECDCLDEFSPSPGKYVASFWVKSDEYNESTEPVTDYPQVGLEVTVNSVPVPMLKSTRGNVIDGWQRHEYTFEIPTGSEGQFLKMKTFYNPNGEKVYIDDFRFHGFLTGMKTYVYDPTDLKVLAELDNNNYAKIYQYNEAGQLAGVKVETRDGIQSLQEVRYNQYNRYE